MKIEKGRDLSQRLTVEINNIIKNDYPLFTSKISKKFNLIPSSHLINGVNESFQDFTKKKYTIGLEWDIWSGYIIVAKDKESELLVNKIYDWLILEDL
jgi:hypothetical protein